MRTQNETHLKFEDVVCEIIDGKEVFVLRSDRSQILKEDGSDGSCLHVHDNPSFDQFPLKNWRLNCNCNSLQCYYWGKDAKGADIFMCSNCGKRFLPCSFCKYLRNSYSNEKAEFVYFYRCHHECHQSELRERAEKRKEKVQKGEMTEKEGVLQNIIDERKDVEWELIANLKNSNKAVFAKYGVYDFHGYKSVSQYISIYSICPKGAEIILERYHSSGVDCVSTNRDYLAGIEIKSVESVFASRGRYPSISLKKDDTEIAIKWLDGTVENFTI